MLTSVGSMGVWGVITALIFAQLLRLVLFYSASQYFYKLNYPVVPIALLSLETILWILFSVHFDSVIHQLIYSLVAGFTMTLSAVVLKLIPVFPNGLSPGLNGKVALW